MANIIVGISGGGQELPIAAAPAGTGVMGRLATKDYTVENFLAEILNELKAIRFGIAMLNDCSIEDLDQDQD